MNSLQFTVYSYKKMNIAATVDCLLVAGYLCQGEALPC
jgi:hypothetical protein